MRTIVHNYIRKVYRSKTISKFRMYFEIMKKRLFFPKGITNKDTDKKYNQDNCQMEFYPL